MYSVHNDKPRTRELYEVIEEVSKAKTRKEKKEVLKKYEHPSYMDYYRCLFDDRVQFLLPEGKPPYTTGREESTPSSWLRENKKLTYIVKGLKADNLIPLKREKIFIGILESVHPKDALLLVDMVQKKAPKGLTRKLIQEVFPQLLPE
jgi:hypothetical protein